MANQPFKNYYLVWDTESTGNKVNEDDIISIGGVLAKYENNRFTQIGEFHSFISTSRAIDPAAAAVHHITKAQLLGEPNFAEVMKKLSQWLKQYLTEPNARLIMMAHNGRKFDEIILYTNFVRYMLDFDQFLQEIRAYGFVDTLPMLRELLKNCPAVEQPKDASTGRISFALGHCYASFCQGSLENAHNALADSKGLFAIINAECVTSKLCLSLLFKNFVWKKDRAVKMIKQSAGVFFKMKEESTRQAKIPCEVKTADELPTEPIFEQLPAASDYKLCLNCMTFTKLNEHLRCVVAPVALSGRV